MGKRLSRRSLIVVDIFLTAILVGSVYAFTSKAAGAPLNSKGSAYELNLDQAGKLWISDPQAGEVWGVDPASGSYEIYPVTGSPVDARQAAGSVWWADGQSNLVGQVSASDGSFSEWRISGAWGFLGTGVDADGRLYLTDASNPLLYRLDAEKKELCTYSLPGFGASNYIVSDGEYLWLGDWFDASILRLRTADHALTWWSLPPGSSPFGMVADGQGNLWYADQGNGMLARLDPATGVLTGYLLPTGHIPQMVANQAGLIWFTEQSLPGYGYLDPRVAESQSVTLTGQDQQVEPGCAALSPSMTGKMTITMGKLSWGNKKFRTLVDTAGWQIYQLPKGSDPWGIVLEQYGYLVDSGHQLLLRFSPVQELPPIAISTGAASPTPGAAITQASAPPSSLATPTALPPTPTLIPTAIPQVELSVTFLPTMIRDLSFGPAEGVIPPTPLPPYPVP